MKRYSKDYYREEFQCNSTERLLFQYANLDLNKEASEAIYEILSQRGEVVPQRNYKRSSSDTSSDTSWMIVSIAIIVLVVVVLLFALAVLSVISGGGGR